MPCLFVSVNMQFIERFGGLCMFDAMLLHTGRSVALGVVRLLCTDYVLEFPMECRHHPNQGACY